MIKISGIISLGIGILILMVILKWNNSFIIIIYSGIFILIGLIILLRKNENIIEKIDYGRLKYNDKR